MDPYEVPTKGNLMRARYSLSLATQGYSLMDRKRNILIRELTTLIEKARSIQREIDSAYSVAYAALQKANIEMGITAVARTAERVPVENGVELRIRSVMGTEIPLVRYTKEELTAPSYPLMSTTEGLDEARSAFNRVKELTIELSGVEISAHRLAADIQRTQKRANALKNIQIPRFEALIRAITAALEEKEREEFTRLKVIKRQKGGAAAGA